MIESYAYTMNGSAADGQTRLLRRGRRPDVRDPGPAVLRARPARAHREPRMIRVIIYGAIDPRTNHLRYVGKTKIRRGSIAYSLRSRCAGHLKNASASRAARWFRSLGRIAIEPEMFVIEIVAEDAWIEAERFWIAYFKSIGCELTNATIGGEGVPGFKLSPERIAYLHALCVASRRGSTNTIEHRRRISEARRGQPAWNRGKKAPQCGRSRPKPPGHHEKMIAALRAKITGVPKSTAHRAAIAEAQRRAWARRKAAIR